MASDVPAGSGSRLDWLLADLAGRVPHTRGVVLASSDGLPTAVHGLSADRADQLAAVTANLFAVSRAAGIRFGGSDGLGGTGSVRQVVIELDDTLLFVSSAGERSVLAMLAGREADAGQLGYEMAQLVKSVQPFLSTSARRPGIRPHGAAAG